MIQFNLLPDIKIEFLKAQRAKQLAMSISTVVIIVCVAVFLLMLLLVDVVQKKSLNDVNSTISTYTAKINSMPNLNKILTVQNQLMALPELNAKKPVLSNLFNYITALTPNSATISSLQLDLTKDTVIISGQASSLTLVNQFVDDLKFATYSLNGKTSSNQLAFKDVVLNSFTTNTSGDTYTLNADFVLAIFSSATNVSLTVPTKNATPSALEQPTVIFAQPSVTQPGGH